VTCLWQRNAPGSFVFQRRGRRCPYHLDTPGRAAEKQNGITGVWIYKQATPSGVKKSDLAAKQIRTVQDVTLKKEKLRARNIEWRSPAELNPNARYD